MASDIYFSNYKSSFKVSGKDILNTLNINLNIPGKHNIYNALAAISIALELDISNKDIINGLGNYKGVKRRFETKFNIESKNILFIDDYAHHPKEIKETLKSIKSGWPDRRIITIFQPHLFSRTMNFYIEFANALILSDYIILTDIYAAREKPIKNINSNMIINEIKKIGHKNSIYINKLRKIPQKIKKIAKNDDIIITMGAGNIYTIIKNLYNEINN